MADELKRSAPGSWQRLLNELETSIALDFANQRDRTNKKAARFKKYDAIRIPIAKNYGRHTVRKNKNSHYKAKEAGI